MHISKYMQRFKIIFIVLLLFIPMALTATAEVFKVKGSVVDADGDGEIYATVRVYADSDTAKPVAMDVTDLRGDFNLSLSGAGRYRLNVSSVGKVTAWRAFSVTDNEPMAVLDTIVTEISENVIGEVVVEAAKPLVAVEIDRITYDVAADMESAVSMVSEILTKVPLVSVDADGTIKVNGSTSFKIYKNGRPNNTFSNNAKELFKALPAAMIQKIEVITDPGAREDAEGTSAILNIVTVKNAIAKGITGNAEVSFNSKTTNIPTPHLWLTGQYGKLSVSVYGGGSMSSRGSSKSSAISETEFTESGNRLVSSTGSSGRGQLGYWGVESSLDIDKRNLVTVEAGGFLSGNESRTWGESVMTDASGNMIYSYKSLGKNGPSRVRDFNGSVNYQHSTARDGETLTLSYRVSTGRNVSVSETEYTEMDDAPMDYTGIDADSRVRSTEHTVQADWSRPTGANGAIDAGGKYIYRDNRNMTTRAYAGSHTDFSDFGHSTHIGAVFADYRLNVGKFGARAGVRYEYSHLSARFPDGSASAFGSDLHDVVPNVSVMLKANGRNTIKLSAGSRIQRPGIFYLNPAVDITPDKTSEGNPGLKSVRQNNVSVNYSFMGARLSVNADAGYYFTDNEIVAVERTDGDHIYSGYANAGRRRHAHGAVYANWRVSGSTSIVLSTSADHVTVNNPDNGDRSAGWGYSVFGSLSQKLPGKMLFMAAAGWKRKAPELYTRRMPSGMSDFMWGLRLRRTMLKDDRLTVGLEIVNPIRARHPRSIVESWNGGMRSRTVSREYRMSYIAVAVGYRFGSLKATVKKVNKGINNDDVVGGSGN